MANKRILMIDDDEGILALNQKALARFSKGTITVVCAKSLAEARACLLQEFNLFLLDIMLPDGNGMDFVHEIRAVSRSPILMLTARGESEQIIEGLMRGGNDYITKPYQVNELYARVTTMMNLVDLQREEEPPKTIELENIILDTIAGRAFFNGKDILLTPREFAVLHYLVRNEGRIVSHKELYEAIWKMPLCDNLTSMQRTVSKLRAKLKQCGYTALDIRAMRNEGYELV